MSINIEKWQARISRCKEYQASQHELWRQSLKLYTGTFFGKPTENNTELSEVNFVYEYVKLLVSAIYAQDPYIFCRSTTAKYSAFAETMERVLNYYWRDKQAKKKIKQSIVNGVLQPPSWVGIGYTIISEKRKVENDILSQIPELKDKNSKQKTEEELGILDETIKDDDVFIESISPWNILFPDGYHDPRECPYVIKIQKIALEDLLNNPMYKKSALDKLQKARTQIITKQQVKPYKMSSTPNFLGGQNQYDDELVIITLYHVWDRRGRKRFTLAENFNEDTLWEQDWNYLIDGFPFYPLIFNEIPATDEQANAYPLSDITPMLPQLKELSYISSAMMRHRKRAGTLLLGRKGQITEAQAEQIQNSSDVDMILVDDNSEAAVRGFMPPPLPQDFYSLRDVILQDLMRISGFSQLLAYVKGIDTATESENVRMGAQLRQSEKTDIIEDLTMDVARGLAGLLWQFISKERVAEIIGEEVSEDMWLTLPEDESEARKIIQRELQFKIDAGSTRPPKDEAIERKQWENLAGVIKANFPNRIKEDQFLKQWLKKYDFHDIDRVVIAYDDQEIASAQEENKLLMQNQMQIVTPNENHMLHLQVHSQAYAAGLPPTQAMDKHIADHAKFMQIQNPKAVPQRGDSKIAPQSNTPEARRQGVPEFADIQGAVNNMSGIGGNNGGPNG